MTSAKEIKTKAIKAYVKEAIGLVKDGRNISPRKNKSLVVPAELKKVLQKNSKAKTAFSVLRLSLQHEYADYIASAKRDDTRQRRIEKIIPTIVAKKGLNDKYR